MRVPGLDRRRETSRALVPTRCGHTMELPPLIRKSGTISGCWFPSILDERILWSYSVEDQRILKSMSWFPTPCVVVAALSESKVGDDRNRNRKLLISRAPTKAK